MKQLAAFTLIACALTSASPAGPNVTTDAIVTRGAFFALSVADIEASTAWYSDKLGLRITLKPPRSGPADVVVLEGGGLIVELIQHDASVSRDALGPARDNVVGIQGFFKAGILVEDFDAAIATLKARGVAFAFGPYPAKEGQRANVIIRDNGGNLIQFFGPAPQ